MAAMYSGSFGASAATSSVSSDTSVQYPLDVELRGALRRAPSEDFSYRRRYECQSAMWKEHLELFETECRWATVLSLIPIAVTIAGFFLHVFNGPSVLSRLLFVFGPMTMLGIFAGYWMGTPEGPPYFSLHDGTPRPPPYYTERVEKYLKKKVTTYLANFRPENTK